MVKNLEELNNEVILVEREIHPSNRKEVYNIYKRTV